MTTLLTDRGEVARDARPFPDLARLLAPVDPVDFVREYWEKKPLHIHRDDPKYYSDLLTLDDMDRVLTLSDSRLARVRVVIAGKETPIAQLGRSAGQHALEALYEQFRNGSTIVVNALESRWESLRRLSSTLGAELTVRLQMNIYLTPAGNQGFAPHYDMHDVFVAQVHGRKHWRLAGQPYELPLHGQPYDKSRPEPEPDREFDLCAGDVLYLPRGTVHWATANESTSVHITIGVHPVLYSQVLKEAVTALFTEDVRFRRSLPVGFGTDEQAQHELAGTFDELICLLRERLSPKDLVTRSVSRGTSIGLPNLRHHLTDLDLLDEIDLGTRVRRRPDLRFALTIEDGVAGLDFHGKTIRLPADVAEELRYVASGAPDGFTGISIPGDLDDDGRLVLITTLVREGFLTRA